MTNFIHKMNSLYITTVINTQIVLVVTGKQLCFSVEVINDYIYSFLLFSSFIGQIFEHKGNLSGFQ